MSADVQGWFAFGGFIAAMMGLVMAVIAFGERDRGVAVFFAVVSLLGIASIIIGATATVTSRSTSGQVEHAPDLRCIAMERVPYADEWQCTQTVRREP